MAILHTQRSWSIMGIFVKHFLEVQTFRMQINNIFSNLKLQEISVPQSSILSVILFIMKINKITICLLPESNGSLYVNNFLICYSSKMATIERKIQPYINKISKWILENGFKIANKKTKCIHFYQISKMHNHLALILNGTEIPIIHQQKFLGITLDSKLSFIPHIK